MSLYYATTYQPPVPFNDFDPGVFGGKGAGLLAMAANKLPVPPALILTTEAWKHYRITGALNTQVVNAIKKHLTEFPDSMFSVRSGAPLSMPGMMDTILNVGVTPELDTEYEGAYKRFAISWLEIVKGLSKSRTNELIELIDQRVGTGLVLEPTKDCLTRYRELLKGVIQSAENVSIPATRLEQATACVEAVFKSWDTPRAKAYRAMHNIPEDMGTGCIIQQMVMGTAKGGLSGSGVMFSRDPATGENKMRGEVAFNAQGEEVVSGAVTPMNIDDLAHSGNPHWEHLHSQLISLCGELEQHFGDVQDIEFTVENGNLYVLQTRTAKMSARARIETACDLAKTLYPNDPEERLRHLQARITPAMVKQTQVPEVMTQEPPLATGLPASPGAISGKVVFPTTPLHKIDKGCILVANETAPEDFPQMAKAGGILTKTGGFTCHSAVVARGIGVPAVVGCNQLDMMTNMKAFTAGNVKFAEGDTITIDGATGKVWYGAHEVKKAQPPRAIYQTLHTIVEENGTGVPDATYYYDCGIGQSVILPFSPADLPHLEIQLNRAAKLRDKGKHVVFACELFGYGEDMFDADPMAVFKEVAENYGPDFENEIIACGVPLDIASKVQTLLGCSVMTSGTIHTLDLLDLLETKV